MAGLISVLEFGDGDQLLDPVVRHRYRHAATTGDQLDRGLDVVGRVIAPVDDQEILDPTDDEQFAVVNKAQITGTQPGTLGGARRRVGKFGAERVFGLLRFAPVTGRDVLAVNPDFTDGFG